jgi:hypothetical protein
MDLDLPVLDLGDRVGYTDYIDFLYWEDIPKSIMKGIDRCNRNFLAFKLGLKIVKEDGSEKMKYFTQVFFERYSKNSDVWVSASSDGIKMFPCLKPEDFETVRNLALGKMLQVDERHGFTGKLESSKYYLANYDYWLQQGYQKE